MESNRLGLIVDKEVEILFIILTNLKMRQYHKSRQECIAQETISAISSSAIRMVQNKESLATKMKAGIGSQEKSLPTT